MSPSRLLLTSLALAFLALGLAACGGSSTPSSSSTAPPPPSGGQAKSATPHGEKPRRSSQGRGSTAAKPSHPEGSSGSSVSGNAAKFRTKGGDNSIQEFGGEGGGSELAQAAAALHGFLDARAAGEWQRVCQNMAAGVTKSLQQLAGGAQSAPGGKGGKPKQVGCPQLIAAMSAGMPASIRRDLTKAEVGALRVEGQRAFLLYHGAHHTDYFMPMAKEGGQWKVAALAASALP